MISLIRGYLAKYNFVKFKNKIKLKKKNNNTNESIYLQNRKRLRDIKKQTHSYQREGDGINRNMGLRAMHYYI